jgi:8-oxo-dGTP diphosphatase
MARTDNRVTGVVIRDGKILLLHRFRDGSEYWVFPGGGVEEGEDLETGLQREMYEETGLNLVTFKRLFDTQEGKTTCIFYRCEMEPGEPTLGGPELEEQSPDNTHILEWVEIERLSNLTLIFPTPDLEKLFSGK